MFDDPKRELHRLEEELKALEPEADFQEIPAEEEEDAFGPGVNEAVDFHRMAYADEFLEDDQVFEKQKKRRKKKALSRKEKKREKKKKHRPMGFQILLALLEIGLIIVILRWWLGWIA